MRSFPLLLLVLSFGCDASSDDTGTPPSIESIELDASDVVVGTPSPLRGTLVFTDPEGDVMDAELTLREPSGAEASVSTPVAGAEGRVEGSVALQITVLAPEAGPYAVEAVLHDSAGNASEPVVATFSAG